MYISGIQVSHPYGSGSVSKSSSIRNAGVASRNNGPDTVTISPAARNRLNELTGKKTEEPENSLGKLVKDNLAALCQKAAETGEYVEQSTIKPGNYEKLKAIEKQIELNEEAGVDSTELKNRKLLISMFGDVRELSEQDMQEGLAMLEELAGKGEAAIAFEKIVAELRKGGGFDQQMLEKAQKEEEEDNKSEALTDLEEAVQSFIHDTGGGASVEIRLHGDQKETIVKRGAMEDGRRALRLAVNDEWFMQFEDKGVLPT